MAIKLEIELKHYYLINDRGYLNIEEPFRQKIRWLLWDSNRMNEFVGVYVDSIQQKRIELLVRVDCFKNLYYDLEGFLRILRLCKNNVDMAISLFEELKCEPEKKSNEQENQLTKS